MSRGRLPTILIALATVASACGGETSTEEADSSPAETAASSSSSTSSTVAEPTTTTVSSAPADPAELAAFVQLRLEDFPAGYDLENELDETPICDGVPSVTVAFPPAAETSTQVTGAQLHFADVAVYEDASSAEEAYEYLVSGMEECRFSAVTDAEDGSQRLLEAERFAAKKVDGADQLTGFTFLLTDASFGVMGEMNLGLRGPLVFRTMSTDPTVVTQLSETVIARAAGDDSVAVIEPQGSLELLPGFGSPEYYSWPDGGPVEFRALDVYTPEALVWIESATDERIDEMASAACVAAQTVTVDDGLAAADAAIFSVFTPGEVLEYEAEVLGEVFGGALNTYCPGLVDVFVQLAEDPSA